jgi:hypothetical protein
VIGGHAGTEPRRLSLTDMSQEPARGDLLVRTVKADDGHDSRFLPAIARFSAGSDFEHPSRDTPRALFVRALG